MMPKAPETREVARLLETRWGLQAPEVAFLREGGSYAYRVRAAGEELLCKLIKPAFARTARQSLAIMRFLTERGFPAQRVQPARSGELCEGWQSDGILYTAALMTYLPGRELEMGEQAEAVGALTGRLHALLRDGPAPLPTQGKAFFIDRYVDVLRAKGCDADTLARYAALGDALWAQVDGLPQGVCHGDLHRGNWLLAPDGALSLLDFDTACVASPMFDVMVFCDSTDYFRYQPEGLPRTCEVLAAFLRGYRREAPLSEREIRALFPFVAIRHYQLQATIAEIYGLDSFSEAFVLDQLDWLARWLSDCAAAQSEIDALCKGGKA